MRKCPNCADENNHETLFCKTCGRCLLSPDPEDVQSPLAIQVDPYQLPEGVEFYDRHKIRKPSVVWPTRKPQAQPSIITGWLLLLNLLALILVTQIAMYIFK